MTMPPAHRVLLLVNGPNLNRLGQRDRDIYGSTTLAEIETRVRTNVNEVSASLVAFQSNHEGALVDFLQTEGPGCSGIILNPGAFGHYSYALRDCLADLNKPCIEVHISNVHQREAFRHQLVLSPVVTGQVVGLGAVGYELAAQWFVNQFRREDTGL